MCGLPIGTNPVCCCVRVLCHQKRSTPRTYVPFRAQRSSPSLLKETTTVHDTQCLENPERGIERGVDRGTRGPRTSRITCVMRITWLLQRQSERMLLELRDLAAKISSREKASVWWTDTARARRQLPQRKGGIRSNFGTAFSPDERFDKNTATPTSKRPTRRETSGNVFLRIFATQTRIFTSYVLRAGALDTERLGVREHAETTQVRRHGKSSQPRQISGKRTRTRCFAIPTHTDTHTHSLLVWAENRRTARKRHV